jgi:hypothetical protein
VIRRLAVWLLALAIPLQGLAAATMLHCVPLRGDASAHADQEHHGSPAAAQHAHGGDAAAHAQATGAAPHDHDGGVAPADHKCSACAACNVGVGLPSTLAALPQPPAVSEAHPVPATVRTAFLTSGPERPPRASAA